MALNIKLYCARSKKPHFITARRIYYTLASVGLIWGMGLLNDAWLFAASVGVEPVRVCVIPRSETLTPVSRTHIASCLGYNENLELAACPGAYSPIVVPVLAEDDRIEIHADNVSFYASGRSELSGHVEIQQHQRIVSADTAYIYRDANKNKIEKIELLGQVRLLEPDRLMLARKVTLFPENKSGQVEDVLYRLGVYRRGAALPSWGRASRVKRFANEDYQLFDATYSTCPPTQESWQIEAKDIHLNKADGKGTAKNAVLRVGGVPLLYTPYLTFPTSRQRKSGFLMPFFGFSNVGGFDTAMPYYWNIAPNYDATIVPHLYTRRGMMIGGDFRYLNLTSSTEFSGHILPKDNAFRQFIEQNQQAFPQLRDNSTDRWSLQLRDTTALTSNLRLNLNVQQVSDDYFLQDFSPNLAINTTNQILRQGDMTYTTDHWTLSGMLQSYQTLHPINQVGISNVYERLPQVYANGIYDDLLMGVNFNVLGQFDNFHWPEHKAPDYQVSLPQGPRYHLNPILNRPFLQSWGFVTPSTELVQNDYQVNYGNPPSRGTPDYDGMHVGNPLLLDSSRFNSMQTGSPPTRTHFSRTIPRFSLDSGLSFERTFADAYTQTLEPRLFYLNVPFVNQTPIPVYDSAYMIFNTDQLFRTNRFSGFDRISDANQLSYAVTSRFLSDDTGREWASLTVGQIRYFANRRVQLCYQNNGVCLDSPLALGYLSPFAKTSPIASHGAYRLNSVLSMMGDYVYDSYTNGTNNANLNLHYQPAENRVATIGYAYLINGNLLPSAFGGVQNRALHQGTVAYATPLNEQWSGLGVLSYNISKGYVMQELLGIQYDSCCWAARVMGGRAFKSLSPNSLLPQYNNNIYFQILLKGLGGLSTNDPASLIRTFLPGLRNSM